MVAVVTVCLAAIALTSPVQAHLAQYTYASGSSQPYSVFPGTEYWNHRDYNQVWHNANFTWGVFYVTTDRIIHGWVRDTANPTRWGGEIGYATPKCENVNDTSGTTFTCQSTGG